MPIEESIKNSIKENLINYRKANKLTGDTIAFVLGIKPSTYRNYETGRCLPNVEYLEMLSRMFNTSIDELIGKPNPNKTEINFAVAASRPSEKESKFLSELTTSEQILVLKYRILDEKDKEEIGRLIDKLAK